MTQTLTTACVGLMVSSLCLWFLGIHINILLEAESTLLLKFF